MYTVKEVADLLDVSQVTIYNHLKKNEKELRGNITKKKGVTYIKDEGLRVLKISLGIIEVPVIKETISLENIVEEIALNVREDIKEDYNRLNDELKEIKEQNKAIQEQNKLLIDMIQDKEKKSFIDKLKDLFK